jgi:agmatinase
VNTTLDNPSAALPEDALYSRPVTFMEVPYRTAMDGARAAILGCPFDCGIHPFRVGARQGPAAIRERSNLIGRFHPERADFDVPNALGLVDCGDVYLTPGRIEEANELMEEAALRIVSAGAAPIGLGGDGSISLPLVRAAARVHPGLVVLHIDSHTDAYLPDERHPFDASTQFTHAALEQRIKTSASFHVGLRGTSTLQNGRNYARELGFNLVTMEALVMRGFTEVVAEIREAVGDAPVYLSWDMDVYDPAVAPGVCTPVWGGLTAREGFALLRMLEGLNIVACDVNTVSPPQDVDGQTAFLAAATIYEMLLLLLKKDA